jgi:hypothetical protein
MSNAQSLAISITARASTIVGNSMSLRPTRLDTNPETINHALEIEPAKLHARKPVKSAARDPEDHSPTGKRDKLYTERRWLKMGIPFPAADVQRHAA